MACVWQGVGDGVWDGVWDGGYTASVRAQQPKATVIETNVREVEEAVHRARTVLIASPRAAAKYATDIRSQILGAVDGRGIIVS